jgi:N-hydroxyarylamine O-acetyltransferase
VIPAEVDLDAYLRRIAIARTDPAAEGPSLSLLNALHEAHVAAIPFENLDILLARPVRLDMGSLQAKLVTARRGGYCFEHNSLFMGVLRRLGFDVTPLAARVRLGATEVLPKTHMLLRVALAEGPFLVDVGFGGEGPIRPLPLEDGGGLRVGCAGCRLRRDGDLWVLQADTTGEWADLYAFTLERHFPADFEMANHYTSTYPTSRFVQNLVVQRSWRDRRVLLRNRELISRGATSTETTTLRHPDQLIEVLEREFGLSFPPGTRFSRPVF